jgi:hypothetical protein
MSSPASPQEVKQKKTPNKKKDHPSAQTANSRIPNDVPVDYPWVVNAVFPSLKDEIDKSKCRHVKGGSELFVLTAKGKAHVKEPGFGSETDDSVEYGMYSLLLYASDFAGPFRLTRLLAVIADVADGEMIGDRGEQPDWFLCVNFWEFVRESIACGFISPYSRPSVKKPDK